MMSLMSQITAYADELDKNLNIQSFAIKIEDCRSIEQKMIEDVQMIQSLAHTYRILKVHTHFEHQLQEKFQYLLSLLKTVKNIWQKDKEQLRTEESFSQLLESLASCHEKFAQALQKHWQDYSQNLKNEFFVEKTLLNRIAHIPGQSQIYFDYVEQFKQFESKSKTLPVYEGDVKVLQETSKKLYALKGRMQFDVPEAVQAFFAQFKQSTSTVNLQIVTPEVFQWLYTHNLLNSFIVQRQWNT